MGMSETCAISADLPMMQYETPDHQLICELAKDLAPYKIAKKFETTTEEVKHICAMYGIKPIGKHGVAYTMKDRVFELLNQGVRQCEIAERLNIDTAMVRKYVWESSVKSGKVSDKSSESIKKAKHVEMLRGDGMSAVDACKVIGISLNGYYMYRNKKAP